MLAEFPCFLSAFPGCKLERTITDGVEHMMRVRIAESLRERWMPELLAAFHLNLATCCKDISSLVVSLVEQGASETVFVCELRGRQTNGPELRVRCAHPDGRLAIAHTFARARREIRRCRLRAGMAASAGSQVGEQASTGKLGYL